MKITATNVNYYIYCKRQLWLSLNYVNMEKYNEDVMIGNIIEENSFNRRSGKKKQINIGDIKVDYIDIDKKIIYETKKSSKYIKSAVWQMKYYLYYLGDNGYRGIIEVPSEKKKHEVILKEKDIEKIENIIKDIIKISKEKCPKPIYNKKCDNCSFYEYCYS